MCGIIGTVNIPLTNDDVNRLQHRGPDGHGLVSTTVDTHQVSFGHRRLSIVDLSEAGHQPMISPAGNLLVYNGEIYNHQSLRDSLTNYPYRGSSDTETILSVVERRGIESVRHFNGIFAFAYLDQPNRKLFLVRDPFGVKPLYYWIKNGAMAFASEMKPIVHLLDKVTIDLEALATLLKLRFIPSPLTMIAEVRKLNPGHILEVDLGSSTMTTREYSFDSPNLPKFRMSFHEALELYEEHFTKAIESQLMADVDVGILLSGGIDSAMVGAVAASKSSYKMKAFTVGFDEKSDSNEIDAAAKSAALLGLDHHYLRIGSRDFFDGLERIFSIVEEPLATDSIIPMYHLCKLASQHVKVVLTGQGADEPLGGYTRYQGELLLQKTPRALRFLSPYLARLTKNESLLRGLNAAGIPSEVDRFTEIYSLFSNAEIGSLLGAQSTHSTKQLIHELIARLKLDEDVNPVARMMAIDLRFNLADDLLLYTDKIAMHHSLEARVPMLDHNLIAFLESLPIEYKVRIGRRKIIHKRFAEKLVDKSVIQRKKLGFLSPTTNWFRENQHIIKDILLSDASKFSNYVDRRAVEAIIKQHLAGYDKRKQIFLLLNLYYWFQEFTGLTK